MYDGGANSTIGTLRPFPTDVPRTGLKVIRAGPARSRLSFDTSNART